MSEEQLKAFLEKVEADPSLQEKLKAAADANAIASIAKEAGFSISAEDLTKAQSELSDQELEGVAGGWGILNLPTDRCGKFGEKWARDRYGCDGVHIGW